MSDPIQESMDQALQLFLQLSADKRVTLCRTLYAGFPEVAAELHHLSFLHESEKIASAKPMAPKAHVKLPQLSPLLLHSATTQIR